MQDGDLLISGLLEYGLRVYGDTPVLHNTTAGVIRCTFRQVACEAGQLAHALAGLGVAQDDVVGTLCWNTPSHLAAYLGVPAMGAVLHTLNLRLHRADLVYILRHADDRVLIADIDQAALVADLAPELPLLRHVLFVGDGELPPAPPHCAFHKYADVLAAASRSSYRWPALDERAAAELCYTSGTTGRPKGVAYSHRSLWLHALSISSGSVYALSDADAVLPVVPMFHANAWGLPHAAWITGAGLVMPGSMVKPVALAELITQERPTVLVAVPTVWSELARAADSDASFDYRSLRLAVSGGSAMPGRLARDMARHGVTLTQGWGMTETSPLVAYTRLPAGTPDADAGQWTAKAGRLIPGLRIRVMGEDQRELAWDGRSGGELEVAGPTVTGTYFKAAPDPEKFRDGWLRTGDLGTVSHDGWVAVSDRLKDGIKSGGEWVSTPELEAALLEHPDIAQALVVGVPDDKWGERPLACVVLSGQVHELPVDIDEFLAERVARFWIPDRWMVLEELPKTSVGKLDKARIRQRYANGELSELRTRRRSPRASAGSQDSPE